MVYYFEIDVDEFLAIPTLKIVSKPLRLISNQR